MKKRLTIVMKTAASIYFIMAIMSPAMTKEIQGRATYLGGWAEGEQACEQKLTPTELSPGEYVFTESYRFNFEGKCRIVKAVGGAGSWTLDEICGNGASQKMQWSLKVDRDKMTAVISNPRVTPAFDLRRCPN